MRVQVVQSIVQRTEDTAKQFSDVSVDRALKNFSALIEGDDSLFTAEQFRVLIAGADPDEHVCIGTTVLRFKSASQASNRSLHFSWIEKFSELLRNAGAAETLTGQLALSPAPESDAQAALALQLHLEARGNTREQAALRWGLGLAHVQQALLFVSRQLRQQIGQSSD